VEKINVVCLCDLYNLKEFFGKHFATDHPWIHLLLPEEVSNPGSIQHALAFSPGSNAFEPYPNLRLVSCAGAGVDALLGNPSLKAGVDVSRVILAEQAQMIAGFAIWYIHGWQRRMWEYTSLQSAKDWHPINRTPPSTFPVGILGCGKTGGVLARTLQALGYPVTAYGNTAREEQGLTVLSGSQGLIELARKSCAIVNLLPLTEDTHSLLAAEFFANMRDDAILIHLGRGAHLVEDDLIRALDQGRPAIAALDVFMEEPLPTEHSFWEHEKIILTPHVAGDADYRAITQFIADGICQFEKGNSPEGLVDRDRGY